MSRLINLVPVWDRSRHVADWKCPRARYWGYDAYGHGVSKGSTSLELYLGTTVHDALASIAILTKDGQQVDIDELALAAAGQMRLSLAPEDGELADRDFADEQAALVEGLVRGFYKHVWPRIMREYPVILYVEEEMEYPHDLNGRLCVDSPTAIFMSKPDLIVCDEAREAVVYFEYKTTSTKKESWINSWDTAVQLHSTIRAVKHTTGIDVNTVVIQGLYKGYEAYGKQSSPMCYAYKKSGNPPFSTDQLSYEYRAGLKKFPAWDLPGGVKDWVEGMPEAMLSDQYPQTPPIFLNDDLIDSFFRQAAIREAEIVAGKGLLESFDPDVTSREAILDRYFPQKFDQCQPGFGWACQFKKICHGNVSDPLDEGFTKRQPHHKRELDQQATPQGTTATQTESA